jgi:small subunit ribosomal protein S18
MARRTPPRRSKPRDAGRRGKKKISALVIGKVDYVDYKDAELLRKFVSERSKLKARRVTGNSEQQQREVARAVKNAREMALIPYTNRVTTQRRERRSDDRGARADGPPPRPSGPPPGSDAEFDETMDDETMDDASAVEIMDDTTALEAMEDAVAVEVATSVDEEIGS